MKHIICATLKHWLSLTVVPAEILGEKILELSRKKKKAKSKTQNPKAAEVRQVPRRLLHICTLQLQHGAIITRRCSLARSYRFSSHLPPVRPRSVQLAPPRWCRESEGVLLHTSSVANGTTDGRAPSKNLWRGQDVYFLCLFLGITWGIHLTQRCGKKCQMQHTRQARVTVSHLRWPLWNKSWGLKERVGWDVKSCFGGGVWEPQTETSWRKETERGRKNSF